MLQAADVVVSNMDSTNVDYKDFFFFADTC